MAVQNGRVSAIGQWCALAACVAVLTGAACARNDAGFTRAAIFAPRLAAAVAVSPDSVTLVPDSTQQLTATTRDIFGDVIQNRPLTWSISDTTVASISSTGLVTALAAGSATVTAAVDGKTATSSIAVSAPAQPPAPTPDPAGWPEDEPAGLTPLLHADGSTKYYFAPHSNVVIGAKWSDDRLYPAANNGTRVQVVADPQSKFGKVVQKWTFTGEQSGFNGEYDWQGAPGFGDANGYKELYIRIVYQFGPNWQWEVAHGQKLYYFATNRTNQSGGGNANSFYLTVDPAQIDFVDQANPPSATASANGDGAPYNIAYRYKPPAGTIAAGKYTTVELWIRANSSPTTADGQARIWVDGTEITQDMHALMGAYVGQRGLSNRIWCGDTKFFGTGPAFNGNFNNTQTVLYWGGSGDRATSNFYFNLSELYISGLAAEAHSATGGANGGMRAWVDGAAREGRRSSS